MFSTWGCFVAPPGLPGEGFLLISTDGVIRRRRVEAEWYDGRERGGMLVGLSMRLALEGSGPAIPPLVSHSVLNENHPPLSRPLPSNEQSNRKRRGLRKDVVPVGQLGQVVAEVGGASFLRAGHEGAEIHDGPLVGILVASFAVGPAPCCARSERRRAL